MTSSGELNLAHVTGTKRN